MMLFDEVPKNVLWQVDLLSNSPSCWMPSRMSAPLTERSVVLLISPLVSRGKDVVHLQSVGVSAIFLTFLRPRCLRLLVCSFSLCTDSNKFYWFFTTKFISESTTVDHRPKNQHKKAWERGYLMSCRAYAVIWLFTLFLQIRTHLHELKLFILIHYALFHNFAMNFTLL